MSVNNSLRSEIAETIANYGPGCIAALYGPFTENPEEEADKTFETMLDDILSLIESKMPEKKDWTKPENHDSGCETQFVQDDEGVSCNCTIAGWNTCLDSVKSILRDERPNRG